jgi:hypothetical protein
MVALAALGALGGLTGCAAGPAGSAPPTTGHGAFGGAPANLGTPKPTAVDVRVKPGTDPRSQAVPADLLTPRCRFHVDHWDVSGVIANHSDQRADYRVYFTFVDELDVIRGLFQVDVTGVEPLARQPFEGKLGLNHQFVDCVVTVERTVAVEL